MFEVPKIVAALEAETSGGPFDLKRSMDDFGPKASCTGVQMMANQLGLRSQKCLTKIAAALKVILFIIKFTRFLNV